MAWFVRAIHGKVGHRERAVAKHEALKSHYIEIERGMRSFAFLRLQITVAKVHDLVCSVDLYNRFPHTLDNSVLFSYALESYKKKNTAV